MRRAALCRLRSAQFNRVAVPGIARKCSVAEYRERVYLGHEICHIVKLCLHIHKFEYN